ncbi:MAG: alpha/beta fold hydrolase [Isosphaeraceae bacterium]
MRRRLRYGMRAFPSYRANDPTRPTVCLVHGVNSSSYGFVHMIKPIEEAGYGVVVFDYPFNRSLEESSARFAADWRAFRKQLGETQPWSIVAHSMGALVSRSYVEGPSYGGDVSTLILVAPVNQGSSLAQTQTILQTLKGLQAVGGERPSTDALAHLGDGLGEAATDMTPGSTFLRSINARPRRAGVAYHILAGDLGPITAATLPCADRVAGRVRGTPLGHSLERLVRFATSDLSQRLDEVSDGTGDGCVSRPARGSTA